MDNRHITKCRMSYSLPLHLQENLANGIFFGGFQSIPYSIRHIVHIGLIGRVNGDTDGKSIA
jgi:hypothetical protein